MLRLTAKEVPALGSRAQRTTEVDSIIWDTGRRQRLESRSGRKKRERGFSSDRSRADNGKRPRWILERGFRHSACRIVNKGSLASG